MTASSASLEAQAKLNLSLRVLARETSGYHQLETIFCRIELADLVTVSTSGAGRSLDCRGAEVGPMEKNLAWRAALAFTEATGWATGFQIEIEKRIPVGGGLGGGSADAAAVLRILNAIAPAPLPPAALATIALRLGADVPFLLLDAPLALAWGRGERLLALQPLPAREVLLAFPPFGINTAEAFGWLAAEREARSLDAPAPLSLDDLDRWDRIHLLAVNDLEAVVEAHHPIIRSIRESIASAGARTARMTGSGSTLFGIFDRRPSLAPEGYPAEVQLVGTRTATRVAGIRFLD